MHGLFDLSSREACSTLRNKVDVIKQCFTSQAFIDAEEIL